jgi:hypothetical protein
MTATLDVTDRGANWLPRGQAQGSVAPTG